MASQAGRIIVFIALVSVCWKLGGSSFTLPLLERRLGKTIVAVFRCTNNDLFTIAEILVSECDVI